MSKLVIQVLLMLIMFLNDLIEKVQILEHQQSGFYHDCCGK